VDVAGGAAAAGAVDDRNRGRKLARHPFGKLARGNVGGAAGAEQHGHLDRLAARILLRAGREREARDAQRRGERAGGGPQSSCLLHGLAPTGQ
jgi:hypothetical protein